jgi:hypothetical protein
MVSKALTIIMQPGSVFKSLCYMMFGFFLYSCSSVSVIPKATLHEEEKLLPAVFSMVFFIHGDGNYLYHDTLGQSINADENTLAAAIMTAIQNPQSEVFIFHQKPARKTLFFFTDYDGMFYYYRNGHMLATKPYERSNGPSRFASELQLFHSYRMEESVPQVKLMVYAGHEIPEFNGSGYDDSYPDRLFTIDDLAYGVKTMAGESGKFDLIILSTCYNGTPHTISALSSYAQTIIASPGNLHLSYFDFQLLHHLDKSQSKDMPGFAKNFAQQSFKRLSTKVQTAVTVVVYNTDQVQWYLKSVNNIYNQALTDLKEREAGSFGFCDCSEDSAYNLPGINEGVSVFYRPSRFGNNVNKVHHSGWQCRRLVNAQ